MDCNTYAHDIVNIVNLYKEVKTILFTTLLFRCSHNSKSSRMRLALVPFLIAIFHFNQKKLRHFRFFEYVSYLSHRRMSSSVVQIFSLSIHSELHDGQMS